MNQYVKISSEKPLIEEGFSTLTMSNETQEIMGTVPSWIIRWGSSVIAMVIAILLLLSCLIKYPDVIKGSVVLTSSSPPSPVVAKGNGKIEQLLVKDGDYVKKDQLLVTMEHVGDLEQILSLNSLLQKIESYLAETNKNYSFKFRHYTDLGEIQPSYNELLESFDQLKNFEDISDHERQLSDVQAQMDILEKIKKRRISKLELLRSEYAIAKERYQHKLKWFNESIVSKYELEESEEKLSSIHILLQDIESERLDTHLRSIELSRLAESIKHKYLTQKLIYKNKIRETIREVKHRYKIFEDSYLLRAPRSGEVSFLNFWSEQQFVKASEKIMYVVASDILPFARLTLTNHRLGQVKKGQIVFIKLSHYPHHQFGAVEGVINTVSLVPNGSKYVAEVVLPRGLVTNYNKRLDYSPEMSGQAEIVTDKLRLITRIFNTFRSLLS